jgi:hypothetical protein
MKREKDFHFHRSRKALCFNVICSAEQIAIARILRAIIIIASGMYSCLAGGFLETHSLEASEGG